MPSASNVIRKSEIWARAEEPFTFLIEQGISKSENLSAQCADIALTTLKCVSALARLIWATGVHPYAILAIPHDIGVGLGANAHLRGGGPVGHRYRAIQ